MTVAPAAVALRGITKVFGSVRANGDISLDDAYPAVRTYRWNGSGFSGSETRLNDKAQRVDGTSWTLVT